MLKEAELQAKYTDDEYQDHIADFNADATNERFQNWLEEHTPDLKRIYVRRLMENDEMVLEMGCIDWARQMFIAWDYNRKKDERIEQEMKEMMGEV